MIIRMVVNLITFGIVAAKNPVVRSPFAIPSRLEYQIVLAFVVLVDPTDQVKSMLVLFVAHLGQSVNEARKMII